MFDMLRFRHFKL